MRPSAADGLSGGVVLRAPRRENVLLCGDAAGAVDPISSEGIPFAILTGAAAGRAVAGALAQAQGRSALDIYSAEYGKIVAPFDKAKCWRWFIYARALQRLFAWGFRFEGVRKRSLTEG